MLAAKFKNHIKPVNNPNQLYLFNLDCRWRWWCWHHYSIIKFFRDGERNKELRLLIQVCRNATR